MPLLKYKCKDCDNIFEELILNTDKNEKAACDKCGSDNVSRHYQGKCYTSPNSSGKCSGNCSGCSGCS